MDATEKRRRQLREAQARLRATRRAAGLKEIIVWVTRAQEKAIRKLLKDRKKP